MDESAENVIQLVRESLAASSRAAEVTCVPTFLIRRPDGLATWSSSKGTVSADWALGYYRCQGFFGERTRLNLYGYPGLLRELSSPPPWVEVEPDDWEDDISEARANELRPLVVQAQEHDEESLVACYRSERAHRSAMLNWIVGEGTASVSREDGAEAFRELVTLAKVLGPDVFDHVCDAVFGFDEFCVAAGVPDLLVWLPRGEPPCWFFSEVKAPGDSLRKNQKEWLHQNWDVVCGHYLITVLE